MEENIEKLISLYSYGQKTRSAEAVSDEACGTIVAEAMQEVEGLSTKLFALSILAVNSKDGLSESELIRVWDTVRAIGKAVTDKANKYAESVSQ